MKLLLINMFFISLLINTSVSANNQTSIWKHLQSGGLVVLMRHAEVDKSANALLRDASCVNERNLSEQGKQQAARIGELFVANRVPVEQVLASSYCRTMDTARIAFKNVQTEKLLFLQEALSFEQANQNSGQLSERIANYRGKGNLVLVTHQPNIEAVSLEVIEKGAFLVIKPVAEGEFEIIGKIYIR